MTSRWIAGAALALVGCSVLDTSQGIPELVPEPVGAVAEVTAVERVVEVPVAPAPVPLVVAPTDRGTAAVAPVTPPKPRPPRPKDAYNALRWDIATEREMIAFRRAGGQSVLDQARTTLRRRLPELMEKWIGTRYSYNGTSQVPKTGKIACGYYVTTVLEHAGFDLDRVDLARQPSEQLIRSLVPDPSIERFSFASRTQVVKRVEALGEGVYLAGLDTHIGFLVNKRGQAVKFCHSTSRQRKIGVICEPAKTSKSFASRYTVLGKLEEPPLLDAWLAGARLPSARKHQPQSAVMLTAPEPLPLPPLFSQGLFEL